MIMRNIIGVVILVITTVENIGANIIPQRGVDSSKGNGIELSVDEYAKSTHDFAQHFMRQVWSDNKNFVFSPLSMHITLSMLASSATENSDTQTQLLHALGRTKNLELLERYYQSTLSDYEKNMQDTFKFGNHIWTTKELFSNINDTFVRSLDENYLTGFSFLEDVEPEKAINDWISAITHNKIKKLYDQLPGDVSLLLTNAIWFKDSWNQPFDPVFESDRRSFYLSNGSKVEAEMMERTSYEFVVSEPFQLKELTNDLKYKAISIPYEFREGKQFEIVFLISARPNGLEFLKEALKEQESASSDYQNIFDTIDNELKEARKQNDEYTVVMPSFKIGSSLQAEQYLRQMGVKDAFDAGDFGYMAEGIPLRVSGVKHKATVEVTVQGTEGAAATGIDLVPLSFSDFREVRIDRPFIFFIRDRQKGSFLFVGKIENPNEENVPR